MKKCIIFPFDDEEGVEAKVKIIESIIGEDNVCRDGLVNATLNEVTIRCTKKEWKRIAFKLDLCKVYY